MAFTSIVFKNKNIRSTKIAPVGLAWTVLFFGFWPPLLRRDWKWAGIMFATQICTLGLAKIFFMFIYNKLYITDLISAGYKAHSSITGDMSYAEEKLGFEFPRYVSLSGEISTHR